MTPAEKYRFDPQTLETLERLSVPFAVYQFVDKKVVTLALSEGFCKLFGCEFPRKLRSIHKPVL